MPSLEVALTRLRELLKTADFHTETTNSLIQRLAEEFDEDLSEHRKALKAAINEYLLEHTPAEDAVQACVEPAGDEAQQEDHGADQGVPESAWSVRLGGTAHLAIRTFSNKASVDIRKYWTERESHELKPSKKGISLSPEQWKIFSAEAENLLEGLRERKEDLAVILSQNRLASVLLYQGRYYVDVREFYEKDGNRMPSQKGIFLDDSCMETMVSNLSNANKELEALEAELAAKQPAKKAKTEQGATTTATTTGTSSISKSDAPKSNVIELGDKKRVTVSEFKGRQFVDMREWYEKDGELKPGKKGVSLPVDAWHKLCSLADKVTAAADKADVKFLEQLAGSKKVAVTLFNGKTYVNVREYYEKGGQSLPGQKGLSMRLDQWKAIVTHMDSFNKQL